MVKPYIKKKQFIYIYRHTLFLNIFDYEAHSTIYFIDMSSLIFNFLLNTSYSLNSEEKWGSLTHTQLSVMGVRT